MADLLDRILGLLTPTESHLVLPPAAIIAAMRERQRGELTQAQINAALGLSASDITGFNTVYANCTQIVLPPPYTFEEVFDMFVLGSTRNRASQSGAAYYSKDAILARLFP